MFSFKPRAGAILTAAALVAVAGCKESLSPDKKVSTIEVSPKSARLYLVGQQAAFSATLLTEAGTAGEGIEISWAARDPLLLQVNSSGVATTLKKGGSTYVVATAGGKSDSALVEVPATPCGTVAATTTVVGQVVTDIGPDGFCATASAGEYTVIVHNNSLSSSGTSSLEITGIALDGPPATSGPSLSLGPPNERSKGPWRRRDVAAEMRHRRNEQATMAPLAAAMRTWYAARKNRATFDYQVPAVGDLMTLNVNTNGNGCTDARTDVASRVAAVSNSAIVLADPRNPSGGFTDAEYAEFGAMFDSIIHPLGVTNFGAPSDLDGNSRVLLVFTKSINERTPAGADYYVGGLTHSRDLVSKSICAGSNEAEMFYLLVPDPAGAVNGNEFEKSFVTSVTDATVAHEYQHLINFARRRVLSSVSAEELWLNEGLSHMAEELLYYRRSGQSSRNNNGFNQVYASNAQFNLFAWYMGGDFLNYDEYASKASTSSPFRAGDDLTTRGATWSFLRYAVDQKFPTDGLVWFNLVNSGESGLTNLQNRLGVDAVGMAGLLRDFNIAVYADDYVTGIASKYTHPSWNMRSIYPGLQGYPAFDYPLTASSLTDGRTFAASISTGGFKLYRFKGIGGADSFIRLTGAAGAALPSSIRISVIRTK